MPKLIRSLFVLATLALGAVALPAQAKLKVLATTPDWASLLSELGGDKARFRIYPVHVLERARCRVDIELVASQLAQQ